MNLKFLLAGFLGICLMCHGIGAGSETSEAACHADTSFNREIIEGYISAPSLAQQRVSDGTTGLTGQQIQLVQSADSPCAALDSLFATSLQKVYSGTTDKFYDLTYYKVGDFYFVARSIRNSPDPDWHAFGVSTLAVFDDSLNFIHGISF